MLALFYVLITVCLLGAVQLGVPVCAFPCVNLCLCVCACVCVHPLCTLCVCVPSCLRPCVWLCSTHFLQENGEAERVGGGSPQPGAQVRWLGRSCRSAEEGSAAQPPQGTQATGVPSTHHTPHVHTPHMHIRSYTYASHAQAVYLHLLCVY